MNLLEKTTVDVIEGVFVLLRLSMHSPAVLLGWRRALMHMCVGRLTWLAADYMKYICM